LDAVCLDGLLAEIRPLMLGRHLLRLRPAGRQALVAEVSGRANWWLWLSVARGLPGLFLLSREEMRAAAGLASGQPEGRGRQALLLLRKHLEGARVASLTRIPGERAIAVRAGDCELVLRLSGATPALGLAREGSQLASFGEGASAWPPPAPAPEKEWGSLGPAVFREAAAGGALSRRQVLGQSPGLGPVLAAELVLDPNSFGALSERLRQPRPTLFTRRPLAACSDQDLASAEDVVLLPLPLASLEARGLVAQTPGSWREATALFLGARLRGIAFAERRQQLLEGVRRESRRLRQLEAHLAQDLAGLASEDALRREGEALLAFTGTVAAGAAAVEVPDPYQPERSFRIGLDPKRSLHANADRLFEKARRMTRARGQIEGRLEAAGQAAEAALGREQTLLAAASLDQLSAPGAPAGGATVLGQNALGGRRYLTSGGLSLLVGRAARENQRLTFTVARPEDLWLHARDVPGAHVILRDNEGRAGPQDLREAAEVAAFFSEAKSQGKVDVHVTRRKHLRPARGSPGRVQVGHSETLRVTPRDPEGRLRKR
jgi:hypothetical protein